MSEKLGGIFETGKAVIDYWRETWISNAARSNVRLMRWLAKGRAKDLPEIPKAINAPGFILASGPSLDDAPWDGLKVAQAAGAGIFAATSNVTASLAHGLTPNYVMVVDANQDVPKHTAPYAKDLAGATLLAPPIADPDLFRIWRGPVALFKPIQMGETFVMEVLPKMYAYRTNISSTDRHWRESITIGFLNAGCYTNGAVLAAAYLGYDPIFLVGNDLGFGHGRSRCTLYKRKVSAPDCPWEIVPPHPPMSRDALRRAANGVMTTGEFLHYKLNLFIVWRLCAAHLYNTTPNGIVRTDEMPLTTIEDAINNWMDLRDNYPLDTESEQFHDHVRLVTEKMGMTIKKAPGGLQFDEVGNRPCSSTPIMTQSPGLSLPGTVVSAAIAKPPASNGNQRPIPSTASPSTRTILPAPLG